MNQQTVRTPAHHFHFKPLTHPLSTGSQAGRAEAEQPTQLPHSRRPPKRKGEMKLQENEPHDRSERRTMEHFSAGGWEGWVWRAGWLCITFARRSPHALCYRLGALQLGPWHMTSLGVATEMSARSSASRTSGAGGWAGTGTGITACDTAVTRPWPPERPRRSWGSAVQKGRTKLCLLFAAEGRRQRSRWGSFPYGQTTRLLIRGVKPRLLFHQGP